MLLIKAGVSKERSKDMEKIKVLTTACESNTYDLSVQMSELKVIQGAVSRLSERIDNIVNNNRCEYSGMTYLSINEIYDTVRLIDMGFRPLFKEINDTVEQLHSDSSKLFEAVHVKEENQKVDTLTSTK